MVGINYGGYIMKKIKLCIVGCGGICKAAHYPAYQKYADRIEIVAVCDIKPERAAEFADRFENKPAVYTDFKKMFAEINADAVDICTPNYLHSIIAIEAFKKGLNVLCEKPDAVSASEAEKMIKASEDANKLLMVIRNNRFISSSKYLKDEITKGNFGDIYCGRCGWIRRRGIPGKGGWFTTKAESGGGPLIDLGVHMIDLAIWLMGSPTPVAVSGATYTKFANDNTSDSVNSSFGDAKADGTFDVEDLAMGFIRFDNGAVLQIEFSWASNIDKEMNFVELRGTKAGFSWHSGDVTVFGQKENGELYDEKPENLEEVSGHCGNFENFLDVLQYGKEPCFKTFEGLNMIKILSAIYKSAVEGKEITL